MSLSLLKFRADKYLHKSFVSGYDLELTNASDEVVSQVMEVVGDKTAMVLLDSDHSKNHVINEIKLYSQFVSAGNYLIVKTQILMAIQFYLVLERVRRKLLRSF